MAPTPNERLYGTSEPPAAWQTLSAGPLTADFENGQLRYVRFGGREALRAISFLARDRYWGTFPATLSNLTIEATPARFTVRYSGQCAPDAGDLRYEVEIVGEASGRMRFSAHGAPVTDFLTNRTGFVVLHPLDGVAGATVEIEHASGDTERLTLPALIAPHEPATDISAITHEAAPGIKVRVEMTGDAYDMEDQRNWTDASFKTYIRPLTKPKPYTLRAGESFEQSVTLTISGALASSSASAAAGGIATGAALGVVPAVALAVEGDSIDLSHHPLPPGVTTLVGRPRVPAELAGLSKLAQDAGAGLSLQIAIPGHDPIAELAHWAADGIVSVLVSPYRLYPLRPAGIEPGTASLASIARAARQAFPGAAIGGGTMTGFTEFNRNRPPVGDVDFVTHVTSAIVHAADDRSVLESLEALPHVFRSARALASGKPYRLGPSGIGLGLNPDGPPRRAGPDAARATMIRNDPRQRGLFAAAWMLGYAAAVVAHGIEEYAPAHVAGDFGLFDDDGSARPIYHVVRALAEARGETASAVTGLPHGCLGLAFAGSLWIANLTPAIQQLRFASPGRAVVLDSASFEASRRDLEFFAQSGGAAVAELDLGAFAVARVSP